MSCAFAASWTRTKIGSFAPWRTERCSAQSARRSWSPPRSSSSPTIRDQPSRPRPVSSRSSVSVASSRGPFSCCGSSPPLPAMGRHEPRPVLTRSRKPWTARRLRRLDGQPPGERRFRHPGDVVRLALWGTATLLLAVLIAVATSTSEGVTTDVGRVVTRLPGSVREFLLGLIQIAALAVPLAVVVGLVVKRRWHRLLMVALAGAAGAGLFALLDAGLSLHRQIPDGVTGDTWVLSSRFPSLPFLAAVAAVATLGKPWLSRSWRRSCDWGVVVLAGAMAIAGTAGVPEVALAVASGAAAGAAVLVVFGAPNRRPAPATVAGCPARGRATGDGPGAPTGADRAGPALRRHHGRRTAAVRQGLRPGRGDADLLYRSYRTLMLRGPGDERPSTSLAHDVEHQALLLLLARRAGVRCPEVEALARLGDGSVALALECIEGESARRPGARPDRRRAARRGLARGCDHPRGPARASRAACGQHPGGGRPSDDHRPQLRRGVGDAPISSHRPGGAARVPRRARRTRASPGVGRTGARLRRPGDRAPVPPAPGAVGLDPTPGVEGAPDRAPHRHRRGDGQGGPAARAARARPAPDPHDGGRPDRRLLPASPAARQRRRQRAGDAVGQLGMGGRVRRGVRADLCRPQRSGWPVACPSACRSSRR